jgi:hypothetical protein
LFFFEGEEQNGRVLRDRKKRKFYSNRFEKNGSDKTNRPPVKLELQRLVLGTKIQINHIAYTFLG